MTHEQLQARIRREAHSQVRSLLTEGYTFMFDYYSQRPFKGFAKLRHASNRNIIYVKFDYRGWSVFKNGKVIKNVNYADKWPLLDV